MPWCRYVGAPDASMAMYAWTSVLCGRLTKGMPKLASGLAKSRHTLTAALLGTCALFVTVLDPQWALIRTGIAQIRVQEASEHLVPREFRLVSPQYWRNAMVGLFWDAWEGAYHC